MTEPWKSPSVASPWDPFPAELLNARVRFWSCPDHRGAPHRVEWAGDVARCLTCGRTNEPPQSEHSSAVPEPLPESDNPQAARPDRVGD